jgi:uncharacterized protein YjbK
MPESPNISHEIEIKLDLGSFTNYLKLMGFLGHIEDEVHHVNGFFDTEDRELARQGWALRVRAENSRGLVTIKSIGSYAGIAAVRQEIEAQIGRAEAMAVINLQADVMDLPVLPVEYIKEQVGPVRVARLVQFENVRQRKLFKIGDQNYMLEVDKTEFNDGSVDYELELELSDTARLETIEDNLRKLFITLDMPFIQQRESKLVRALSRAGII